MLNSEIRAHTTFKSNFDGVKILNFVCDTENIISNQING